MSESQNRIVVPENTKFLKMTKEENGNFKFVDFISISDFSDIQWNSINRLKNETTRFYTLILNDKYFLCPVDLIEYFQVDARKHIIRNNAEEFAYTAKWDF